MIRNYKFFETVSFVSSYSHNDLRRSHVTRNTIGQTLGVNYKTAINLINILPLLWWQVWEKANYRHDCSDRPIAVVNQPSRQTRKEKLRKAMAMDDSFSDVLLHSTCCCCHYYRFRLNRNEQFKICNQASKHSVVTIFVGWDLVISYE
jgi:hypothetical protein